jgi:hypothetical protein
VTQLWAEPEHPNLATALGGYIGSGAPLVAGFELAAVVLLLTNADVARDVPLAGPAIVAMVLSASLMVLSIRYGFWAVSYWTTPAERLMWNPAAVVRANPLERERRRLAGRMVHFRRLRNRANRLFEFGLIAFLLAVALMLVPDGSHYYGAGWRWAAAGVAGLSLLVHLVWSAGSWLHEFMERAYAWLMNGGNTRRRIANFVRIVDKGLVRGLAVVWPPVRPAKLESLGLPESGDLEGMRSQ